MVASGAVILSTPAQTLPSRVLRQVLGAMFRPNSTGAALSATAGALAGPANTQGELTLLTDTTLRVAPAVFVINGTHNAKQGQYIVPNDELVDLVVPGKDAAQSRRAYVLVRVADSTEAGVASSAATDIPGVVEVLSGALAAANPAYPAVPQNALILGELLIPSVASAQPVTLTRYFPRTTMRGGILPVLAGTGIATPGYEGAPGVMLGEYRDHPTKRLQRWSGAAWGAAMHTAQRMEVVSASADWTTPGPNQICQNLTINPATLFGAGVGALVLLDGRCLFDQIAGTNGANWYLSIVRGDGQILSEDYKNVTGRAVLSCTYPVYVPADTPTAFYLTLKAPGHPTGFQNVRTYADFTTNRLAATAIPL